MATSTRDRSEFCVRAVFDTIHYEFNEWVFLEFRNASRLKIEADVAASPSGF